MGVQTLVIDDDILDEMIKDHFSEKFREQMYGEGWTRETFTAKLIEDGFLEEYLTDE